MFPSSHSNQSGDYLYEIYDIPHHQDLPQHNLPPGAQAQAQPEASAADHNHQYANGRRSRSRRHLTLTAPSNSTSSNIDDGAAAPAAAATAAADIEARKRMRKEIERERRQHMAKLSAKLRSLLPLDSIKGKRAVSDHMNEAVNYIKYLKNRIQELGVKRDKLKRLANLSNGDLGQGSTSSGNKPSLVSCVAVHPYCGGVEIVVNGGFGEESWHLSSLMQVAAEEGLDVVRCVSSQTNEGFLHTIQSEVVSYPTTQLDVTRLEKRLNDLMISYSD